MLQVSQAVTADFPDLQLSTGLEVIAGLLLVPLSAGGHDFIVFLRKGQQKTVRRAGMPPKGEAGSAAALEPRKSFKVWCETTTGRCRRWSDEQLETAGVLALVYGQVRGFVFRHPKVLMVATVHRSLEAKGVCITNHKAHQHTSVECQPRR